MRHNKVAWLGQSYEQFRKVKRTESSLLELCRRGEQIYLYKSEIV